MTTMKSVVGVLREMLKNPPPPAPSIAPAEKKGRRDASVDERIGRHAVEDEVGEAKEEKDCEEDEEEKVDEDRGSNEERYGWRTGRH